MQRESLKFPRQPDRLHVARASRPLSRGHPARVLLWERAAPATAGETPALHGQGG